MARFRANSDNATYLLAGAAKKGVDVSVVKIADGYLTAPDDVVTEAYAQGLDKSLNIDPDTDEQITAADSVVEGRDASEEYQRVRAEAEAKAAADAAKAQADADKTAQEESAKAAAKTDTTARKAAAKKVTASRKARGVTADSEQTADSSTTRTAVPSKKAAAKRPAPAGPATTKEN